MILSRVWNLLLVLATVAGVALSLVSVRLLDQRAELAVRDDLRRDRFELEATLKIEARTRIDAIAPIAAHGDVRAALRESTARRAGAEIDPAVATRLGTRLGELNRQLEGLAGDLLIATDARGVVVAQVGGRTPPAGAGYGEFPLVRRALEGFVRDDVWIVDDEVFRMAARPVIDGGQYVGAILHGKRVDAQFAELLSRRLVGSSVGFFLRDRIFASAMGDGALLPEGTSAPRQEDMAAPLPTVLQDPALAAGERTDPVALTTGGLAVYSRLVGSAGDAQAGYAIARPVQVLGSPTAIFGAPSRQDWEGLPWPVLGGLAALALVIGWLLVWFERDRPLRRFAQAAQSLSKGESERFTSTAFGGALRTAAQAINAALEKAAESAGAAPKRKVADLDRLLGPADAQPAAPAFFGFSGSVGGSDLPPAPAAPASPIAGFAVSANATPAKASAGNAVPPAPAPPARPAPPPPTAAAKPALPPTLARAPVAPVAPPVAPPVEPPVADDGLDESTTQSGVGSMFAAAAAQANAANAANLGTAAEAPAGVSPSPGFGSSAAETSAAPLSAAARPLGGTLLGMQSELFSMPPGALSEEDEDEPTMVGRLAGHGAPSKNPAKDPIEAHHREVFDQYVALKLQCGEAVESLTFEKFALTLRKNTEQILQKHDAASVRFSVYVKEGKAALKATPVRE